MRLKFIVIAIVALLFGYSGFWLYIAQSSDVYLDKTSTALKAQGIDFTYDDYSVSGFPYKIVLTFENPKFLFRNGALEASLAATRMETVTMPWNLQHVILFPERAVVEVALDGLQKKGALLTPSETALSIHNDGSGLYRLSVEMTDVAVESNLDWDLPESLANLAFHVRKLDGPELSTGLFEPKLLEMILSGRANERSSFLLMTSFLAESVPEVTAPALTAWRDMGGTFEIVTLEVARDERVVKGSGSFTLDPDLRPLGVLSIEGATYRDLIDFMETGRWMGEIEAGLVQKALELFDEQAVDAETVPLSFTFQDGYLSLGPVRLMEVGPVIRAKAPDSP